MHNSFLPQAWFGNRRRKWKKEQKKGIVGPSGIRPFLPGSSLIQPSYQRSFQNTVGFSRSAELPSVPLQWFPSSLQSVQAPLESSSNPITTAAAAEPAPLLYHQSYPPFRVPVRTTTQQYPGTNSVETSASSYTIHLFAPAGNPVTAPSKNCQVLLPSADPKSLAEEYPFSYSIAKELPSKNFQVVPLPAADPNSLAEEYPFSYSIAKELPHIFGNVDEDEILERPLTPSFEPPVEFESDWDALSLESDQSVQGSTHSSEYFTDCDQPGRYDSCCFRSYESSSVPSIIDFSYGFLSKGSNFRFYRQD